MASARARRRNWLGQYRGRITPAQAAEGIATANENARRLATDAKLLLEHGRWPSALALAVLAIEEAGKPAVIRGLLVARDEEELRDRWRDYRRHVSKNVAWILPQLVAQGARELLDFGPIFDERGDHGSLLEAVKQIALYTDACGECHWAVPSEVIDRNLAESVVSVAEVLVRGEPVAFSTEPELELWCAHLGPAWGQSHQQVASALLACYEEAQALGVLSGRLSATDMARFLGFEIEPPDGWSTAGTPSPTANDA